MNKKRQIVVTGVAVLVLAIPALAADIANPQTDTTKTGVSKNTQANRLDNTERMVRERDISDRLSRVTTNATASGSSARIVQERDSADRVERVVEQTDRFMRMSTNGTAALSSPVSGVSGRDNRTLTRFDQGNSPADTDTTAQIRKAIHADKNMSMHAKNVQVITKNGRVIMRGPVKNEEEKRLLGEIANRIALPANVENQLEVSNETRGN